MDDLGYGKWVDKKGKHLNRKPSIFPCVLWDCPVIFPVKINQLIWLYPLITPTDHIHHILRFDPLIMYD